MNNSLMGVAKRELNHNLIGDNNYTKLIDLDKLVPAPSKWNFFKELSPTKFSELTNSIIEVGLLTPIVVWEQDDGKYMILSGHHRVKAFNMLKKVDYGKYSKINAIIKRHNELTEDMVQQIIIDTNWAQRELTTSEKVKAIVKKYTQIKNSVDNTDNNTKININGIIAEEYNLTKRQIINYKSLSCLINEILEAIDENKISIECGVHLSRIQPELQAYIYDNYITTDKYKIVNKNIKKLPKEVTKEIIDEVFATPIKNKKIKVKFKYSGKGETRKASIEFNEEDREYFEKLFKALENNDSEFSILE